MTLICYNASNFGCCKKNIFRTLCGKEVINGPLINQIKFVVSSCYYIIIPLPFELSDNSGSNHTTMTGYIYF